MGVALDTAELLAIFLETLCYGVFFTLFWIMFIVLYYRGHKGSIQRRALLPVGVAMLVLATLHLVLDFIRAVQAFISTDMTAVQYYSQIAHPLHVAKDAVYATQTILGDGVLIWRCYIVYNRNIYIVLVTGLMLLFNASVGYYVVWTFSKTDRHTNIFDQAAKNWITVFFTLTMVTNLVCTAAIAWRIYFSRRRLSTARSLLPVTIVIVESGALYSCTVLALLIAYLTKSNGQYTALDLVTPVVGIAFTLIVLQIHFHVGSQSPDPTGDAITSGRWRRNGPAGLSGAASDLGYQMEPVTVRITEHSEIGYPGDKGVSENIPTRYSTASKPVHF